MTAYIKLDTLEYPRHPGDIALDPEGQYAEVAWVDPPAYDDLAQEPYEGIPELAGGSWRMTWLLRDLTPEEIKERSIRFQAANVDVPGVAPDVIG